MDIYLNSEMDYFSIQGKRIKFPVGAYSFTKDL